MRYQPIALLFSLRVFRDLSQLSWSKPLSPVVRQQVLMATTEEVSETQDNRR